MFSLTLTFMDGALGVVEQEFILDGWVVCTKAAAGVLATIVASEST